MHQAFLFEKVAVVVGPWWEPGDPPERGARVELRLLSEEAHRGSESAAQRVVIDEPLFRADLFDQLDGPTGNLRAAHFHAGFDGVEPRDRQWPDRIREDPTGWLTDQLGDLRALLRQARAPDESNAAWIAADAAALRKACPAIIAAVEATWTMVRHDAASSARTGPATTT
jgi:hypothetical protein